MAEEDERRDEDDPATHAEERGERAGEDAERDCDQLVAHSASFTAVMSRKPENASMTCRAVMRW